MPLSRHLQVALTKGNYAVLVSWNLGHLFSTMTLKLKLAWWCQKRAAGGAVALA